MILKYRPRIHKILRIRKQRLVTPDFTSPLPAKIVMSQSQDSTATIIEEAAVVPKGPALCSLDKIGDQYLLTHDGVERTFRGLIVATKLDEVRERNIRKWLSQQQEVLDSQPLSVNQWLEAVRSRFSQELEYLVLMNLIVGISYMRERGRHSTEPEDVVSQNFIWPHIYAALANTKSLFKPSRSSAGFMFVPLCSLIKDGAIDELWRLHVWLPDGHRADPAISVHGHHAFGQSWILAGEGTNHRWAVDAVDDDHAAEATHAEYRVSWDDGKGSSPGYKTHQVSSTIVNTYKYFRATRLGSEETERRGMTYSVSQDEWHSSTVAPEIVFATLFVFDAHRGANKDAAILGPRDGESFTTSKDPEGNTADGLVRTVESLRRWEDCVAAFSKERLGEAAEDEADESKECTATPSSFDQAMRLCKEEPDFPNRDYYVKKTLEARDSVSKIRRGAGAQT
ncbi:hypothetical protein PFICI_14624 [Pestalotiopsis fici W106-1]|uniref:Uncharacterized protein n=1 Tax=Pestalotiopsis fici (strain W106-1 / CGMCC3.15140) TaxID=1229662 RepID=W3WIG9_PESFW|nr:uncharacterized protein PFICI_14624 [Pestalotiopsis fici W106-1]ETS73678.1 hypothetical protein PFICI_14624 [Pestalotiopsis fici W106-1]